MTELAPKDVADIIAHDGSGRGGGYDEGEVTALGAGERRGYDHDELTRQRHADALQPDDHEDSPVAICIQQMGEGVMGHHRRHCSVEIGRH